MSIARISNYKHLEGIADKKLQVILKVLSTPDLTKFFRGLTVAIYIGEYSVIQLGYWLKELSQFMPNLNLSIFDSFVEFKKDTKRKLESLKNQDVMKLLAALSPRINKIIGHKIKKEYLMKANNNICPKCKVAHAEFSQVLNHKLFAEFTSAFTAKKSKYVQRNLLSDIAWQVVATEKRPFWSFESMLDLHDYFLNSFYCSSGGGIK